MNKTQFDNLSNREKLVLVARDVLKQLKKDKYRPYSTYFSVIKSTTDVNYNNYSSKQLQDYVTNDLQQCEVCAIGSMLISYISLFDGISGDKLFAYILEDKKIITKKQRWLIEGYFEAHTMDMLLCRFSYENKFYCAKNFQGISLNDYRFTSSFTNRTEKLKYIMNNIIYNNGVFILPRSWFRKNGFSDKLYYDFREWSLEGVN